MIHFLDTSAILNSALPLFIDRYISPLVVSELENIKTGNKDEHTKNLARQAVREILIEPTYLKPCERALDQRAIKRVMRRYPFLSDITDHQLLCEAVLISENENEPVSFVTSDGSLYLFAKMIPEIKAIYFESKEEDKEVEYCGWRNFYPNQEEMALLYSNPEMNVLKAETNEFCKIYEGADLKDVLFWNGKQYTNLKYGNFTSPLGERISPRNLEQKMLFHLLQNHDIKIKLCQGNYGSGKTSIMLYHALQGIKEGRFSKIIYVRNNIITKGSREIGYLAGNLVDKVKPFMMQLADLTSPEYLDQIIEEEIIEPVPLGFMRGRDFSNSTLVFCDEAENLTKENIQLLIGRIGEGSELWIAGDLKQIDHKDFEKNNGIRAMIKGLAGDPLFGMVKLIKSERSKTSALADKLDNI